MSAKIIDGKAVAAEIRGRLTEEIKEVVSGGARPPCLAVVLVGDDPASKVYVSHKEKGCAAVGVKSLPIYLCKKW